MSIPENMKEITDLASQLVKEESFKYIKELNLIYMKHILEILSTEEKINLENAINKLAARGIMQYNVQAATISFEKQNSLNSTEFSAMQGWQCPICKRVYSPFTYMCTYCGSKEVKTEVLPNTKENSK